MKLTNQKLKQIIKEEIAMIKEEKTLYQRVQNYAGTNGQYFHQEDLRKLETGGAEFVILAPKEASKYDRKYKLYPRTDGSIGMKGMKQMVKKYKGSLVK